MDKTIEELREELNRVRANYDSLYDHYTYVVDCKNEDIAELKAQLKAAGQKHFADADKMHPEGVEWPRFEDGEPVKFGDLYLNAQGNRSEIQYIGFRPDGFKVNRGQKRNEWKAYGEPVKRPDPEVLDADGVPIKVGDTVYSNGGLFVNEFIVKGFSPAMHVIAKWPAFNESMIAPGYKFTHRKPDTQEDIDADAQLLISESFFDSRRDMFEDRVLDLLKRQRKLLGGE